MLKGHNIICFSNDWQQDPLDRHHIMSRLAKHNRILWINSIGLRKPTASRKDIAKIGLKLKLFFKGLTKVDENFYVISPLVIPFHGNRLAQRFNGIAISAQIKYYQHKLGLKDPILWFFLPTAHSALGRFGEKLSIYSITDDFTQFTGHPAKAVEEMEDILIKRCDILLASAKRLVEKKSMDGKRIIFFSHGVEYKHFSKALSITPDEWPSDIKGIRHPIVGFYGEINDWLDLTMLAEAAKKRAEWSWVIIGRIAVEVGDISFLSSLPNVFFLGQKEFKTLPAYCAAFDVALIPMKLNELTLCVNPLKLREYLAAGVPVVSAPLPEVLPYGDIVKFATTADETIRRCEEWLREDRKRLSPLLSRRVAGETWDAKVEEISGIIQKALSKDGNMNEH